MTYCAWPFKMWKFRFTLQPIPNLPNYSHGQSLPKPEIHFNFSSFAITSVHIHNFSLC